MKDAKNAAAAQFGKAFLAAMGLPDWEALNQAANSGASEVDKAAAVSKVVEAATQAAKEAAEVEKTVANTKPSLVSRIGAGIARPFKAAGRGIKKAASWTGTKIANAYRWVKAKCVAAGKQIARPFKWMGKHIAEAARVTKKFLYELRFIGFIFRGIGSALKFIWDCVAFIVKMLVVAVVFVCALVVGIVMGLISLVTMPFKKSEPRESEVTNADGSTTRVKKFIFGSRFETTVKNGKEVKREMIAKGGKVLISTVIVHAEDGSYVETTTTANGDVTVAKFSAAGDELSKEKVKKESSQDDSFRGAQPGAAAA